MKIVDKFLMELESQLVDKDVTLNVSVLAKNKIQELGFDIINGARPMAKVIQEKIKIPISELILKSKNSLVDLKLIIVVKKIDLKLKLWKEKKKTSYSLNGIYFFKKLSVSITFPFFINKKFIY